jgi:hypothetical protein
VPHPLGAGEEGGVGQAADHPERRRRARPRRPQGPDRRERCRRAVEAHARAGALARLEVAVRREVGVGGDHDAARDAELGGEHARGRQRRAGDQPPRLDRRPQAVLETLAQAAALLRAQVHEHVAREGIGLLNRHEIGR